VQENVKKIFLTQFHTMLTSASWVLRPQTPYPTGASPLDPTGGLPFSQTSWLGTFWKIRYSLMWDHFHVGYSH